MRSNYSVKLIAAFIAMFIVIVVSSITLSGARWDLTENGLYTLSEGTETILGNLEQEVSLELYFSDKATSQLPALRTYALRVEEMLNEYVSMSDGKISLVKVDPEPFSEAEDAAALAGLQAVPGGARGDEVYFGLVAKNTAGNEEVIPFIQPNKEAFLEYDLTRLISSLSRTALPKVGIYAGVDMQGGFDYMTRQPKQEWAAVQYINEGFDIEWIADDATSIEGIDVLLLVGPQNISESLEFAIDQYVLGGGKALIFVDPYMETMAQMSGMPSVQSSNLDTLFEAWGVRMPPEEFLTDFENSMVVSLGAGKSPARHIGLLSLGPAALDPDDVVLFGLENLNLSSAGMLQPIEGATTKFESIIVSSDQSQPRPSDMLTTLHDPQALLSGFAPTGEKYSISARISGPARTAFPEGVVINKDAEESGAEGEGAKAEVEQPDSETLLPKVKESQDIQVVIVADTDILSDRLWVQVQNFFGQQIVTPWADNGSFLLNGLENLSGQAELISIRSQGRFSRPFEKVDALRRAAEERLLAQQELLEEELSNTEETLMELEGVRDETDGAMFTQEQEAELLKFQQQKLKIRKQLRDVQHQLDQDIEQLGARLKLINILLIPSLICLIALFGVYRKRGSAQA
jgi:gliding motility-associatede transport system auxiliary component